MNMYTKGAEGEGEELGREGGGKGRDKRVRKEEREEKGEEGRKEEKYVYVSEQNVCEFTW